MSDIYVSTSGNDTTGTGSSGNPYATLAKAASVHTAGDRVYIKGGSYSAPTQADFSAQYVYIEAYTTTVGDGGTATITATAAITSIVKLSGNHGTDRGSGIRGLILNGNSNATYGMQIGSGGSSCYATVYNCEAYGCTSHGFYGADYSSPCLLRCYSHNNGGGGFSGYIVKAHGCVSADNGGVGFAGSYILSATHCIADTNGGVGFSYYSQPQNCIHLANCTAYGNTGDGFYQTRGGYPYDSDDVLANCIAYGNGGYGLNNAGGVAYSILLNFATGSNTSGSVNGPQTQIGFVSLSGDPFTNAVAGDFSLNNTAGRGAACRAAGYPGAFPGGLTTGYLDIGAVQHQDAGGTTVYSPSRIIQSPGWAYLEG